MTVVEAVLAGGAVELVAASWVVGALSVGGWAYRRGFAEGRSERDEREESVLPARSVSGP